MPPVSRGRKLSASLRMLQADSIALGIENRDPITVIVLVMKYKLVSVIAMCAGCHTRAIRLAEVRCCSPTTGLWGWVVVWVGKWNYNENGALSSA
jgi:hypothetical protein